MSRAALAAWLARAWRLPLTHAKTLRYDAAPISHTVMALSFQTTEQDMVAAYQLHYTMRRTKAAWVAGAFVLGLVAYVTTQRKTSP